eukprot:jgi/Tetstr1/438433/TSEL_026990.t1
MRRAPLSEQCVEVDMENAHFKLLAGKYPAESYIDNREMHLESVQNAAGVTPSPAKQLFLILIFGGTIATWMAECNVSEDTLVPPICREMFRSIAALKADFETRSENQVFVKAAKHKKQKASWQNTAFALWLQDLEARCMVSAVEFLLGSGVEVEEGFADRGRELSLIAEARDDNTKLIAHAGVEGGHRLLAKVFHGMFPNMLASLGKTDGWFVFQTPRWQSLGMDVD